MPELVFSNGTFEDFDHLRSLQLAAGQIFREYGMSEIASNPATDIATFLANYERPAILVARHDTRIVGFALTYALEDGCHLEQISVAPEFARRGFGTKIVRYIIKLCCDRDDQQLTLTTFRAIPWNEPFYKKLGFRALTVDKLSVDLDAVWQEENATGLDMSQRIIMSLPITAA